MPTAIEKIQAKAKALRKSYPNAKWTDLIKKASTDLKKIGAIGGVSKKKKPTKKASTKKTVAKRKPKVVKVLKQHGTSAKAYDKRHQALQAGRRISKSGRPYTETRSNRSDKGVLLGIGAINNTIKSLHNIHSLVMQVENERALLKRKIAFNGKLGEHFYTKAEIALFRKEIAKKTKALTQLRKIERETLKAKNILTK
jgi:hypothetical protein